MTDQRTGKAVVGAGLAGSVLAAQLGQRGVEPVEVYERRADPQDDRRRTGTLLSNWGYSARGLTALEQIGLREDAMANSLPMRGRTVHPGQGDVWFF